MISMLPAFAFRLEAEALRVARDGCSTARNLLPNRVRAAAERRGFPSLGKRKTHVQQHFGPWGRAEPRLRHPGIFGQNV
jgi:hypothetical protein